MFQLHPLCITFATTLAGALVLTPIARALARRFNVVDRPDGRRKLHKEPVPLWGGVAVYFALLLGLVVAQRTAPGESLALRELSTALMAAAGFVCLLGCIDDSWDLNPRFKLVLQTCSVLPIVLSGYYVDRIVAFGIPIELGWFGIPLTILWLVGCINALNLLDGMDGLASVVGLSTSVMMAILAAHTGHPHVALVAMVLAGALAGFLIYNLPPASIFLGDSGSMIIGLVIGILSIQAALKTSATLSITAPAVALSVPMFDSVLAIVRRRLTGRPFDTADRGHIHHRLLDRGLSNWQALCIIGALCLTTGGAATAATLLSNDALGWIITLVLMVVLVRTRAFGHHELSLVKLSVAAMLARVVHRLVSSTHAARRGAALVQAAGNFQHAWTTLNEEVSAWQGRKLALTLHRAGHDPQRLEWDDPRGLTQGALQWSLGMHFSDVQGNSCDLQLYGEDDGASEPWYLLRLAKLLQSFGQDWLENARHLSPPEPAEAGQVLPLPQPAPAPQHRAA